MRYQLYILLFVCMILLAPTTVALRIDSFTMDLQENNDAKVTIAYHLDEREKLLFQSEKNTTLDFLKDTYGLKSDGIGVYSNTISPATLWMSTNDTRSLVLPGFYFDQFDWIHNTTAVSAYPVLRLLTPDFTPDLTIVNWPNGIKSEFHNNYNIPNMYIEEQKTN